MRALADASRPRILARDSGCSCRVEGASEGAVDGERLRHRWRQLGQREPRANCLGVTGCSLQNDAGDETALRIDGNSTDRVPRAGRRCDEMQRLARHRATNRHDRIGARCRSVERQPNDGARIGTRRRD